MSKATQSPVKFVESLELGTPAKAIERVAIAKTRGGTEATVSASAESYISNKSIVSFASTVSTQSRQDILSSTLLAQLAADKKFPEEEQLKEWFKSYQETLKNLGWIVQGKDFSKFTAKGSVFEMESVVVDILTAALGGAAITIIKTALEAFKKLSNTDSKIIAFEKNTHSLTKGTFMIAVCDESNDAISMKTGAFMLSSENSITQILFFKSSKEKTQLDYATTDSTFNKKSYDVVRAAVEKKLGDKFSKYVAEIEI